VITSRNDDLLLGGKDNNTREVARAVAPGSRVVYVDYDPVVLAHARALLISREAGATEYIDADLRDTDTILEQASQTLDFSRPVAIMLIAILHAIGDVDPYQIVAKLMDAVPPGSHLVLSHVASDIDPEQIAEATAPQPAQPPAFHAPRSCSGAALLRGAGVAGARGGPGRGMAGLGTGDPVPVGHVGGVGRKP